MAKTQRSDYPPKNVLLARLTLQQFKTLNRTLRRVELKVPQVLSEPNCPFEYAYFPECGMISMVSIMENGDRIEVGTIGREGVAGGALPMESEALPCRYFVQANGRALRIKAANLKQAATRSSALRRLLRQYQSVFLAQSLQAAACNGLHSVQQRCCRWLLIAHDRSDSAEIPLTHEFLALMLGVRRASISEVLRPFRRAGLIRTSRGVITILNRQGMEQIACECYRVMVGQFARLMG